MDGTIAQLDKIVELADKYNAMTMVDECHATGFIGKTGRGTPEYCGVHGKVDIITGTLGKALGGASGGFTSGKRNYRTASSAFATLFVQQYFDACNCWGEYCVLDMLSETTALRDKLETNTRYFREK